MPSARAATYYVSASQGSDAHSGTSEASPWKTLAKVSASSFSPGDVVLLKRGEVWLQDPLIVPSSGAQGAPIIFGAYGEGPRPKLDGQNRTLHLITIDGKRHIVVQDMEATNTMRDVVACVTQAGSVTDITLRRMTVHRISESGYFAVKFKNTNNTNRTMSMILVEDVEAYNAGWNGIGLENEVVDGTVRNCITRNNDRHNGIDSKGRTSVNRNITIVGNETFGNSDAGIYIAQVEGALIQGNRIHGNAKGIVNSDTCGGCITRPGTGILIRDNMIYGHPQWGIRLKKTRDSQVMNNAVYDNGTAISLEGTTDVVSEGNCFTEGCLNTPGDGLPGDLDGDGVVTLADLVLLIKMLAGSVPPDLVRADLNEDGVLTIGDVRVMIQPLVAL